jgi:5-methylcytosine-specific restriction endonuclease McrBC regulatory subunit McrC
MLSGQVSEVHKFEESLSGFIVLSEEQSAALRLIGKELASKKAFYRSTIDNEEVDDQFNINQDESPSIIKCEHVGNGRYKLKFLNVIGTISVPNMTFHVLPKIPLKHFTHLAKCAFEEPRMRDSPVSIDSLDAFWEVLANWCVAAIEKVYWRGLISDYQNTSEDLPFIKGRVDPVRTSTQYMKGSLKASCTFDELSIDNPFNRTLKAALVAISRSNSLQDYGLKSRAYRLEKRFSLVGEASRQDIKVKVDRRTQYYENALELSNMFLSGNGVDINAGLNHGKSFLIPTPGIVESAIRKILSAHLAPITVRKQKLVIESDPFYSINPDLVFNNGAVTGDVKYKTAGKDWVRNDVAQATMFATGFEAKAALIISFSKSQHTLDIEMMMGHLPVHRINWNASDLIDPIVAEEELLARVRAFLLRYRATDTGWQRTA